MKTILTFLLALTITIAQAQHQADNWYFGHNAGITFSTVPPSYVTGGQTFTSEGASSISDAAGNLLFYSEGQSVWDRNHNLMPNGTGLAGSFSSTESCIIFPAPGSSTLYYLFTSPETLTPDSFTYNVVDMSLNGGFGAVTVKNVGLLKPASEKLTAVYHSNGTDVWVIGHKSASADYYAWLVTATGVDTVPVISTVGIVFAGGSIDGQGYLRASPCGGKLASALTQTGTLELLDFDNTTGVVSNPITLGTWTIHGIYGPYGVEFSPDNSKLYTSIYRPPAIVQYNLLAGSTAAIIASADTVANPAGTWGGSLQTGPDGKIYFAKNASPFLGCINFPNLAGAACNPVDNVIPTSPSTGVPGLPSFLSSYFCGLNVNTQNLTATNNIVSLYPNPAQTHITINVNATTSSSTKISIVSILGELLFQSSISLEELNNSISIPLTNFSTGIYYLTIQNKDSVKTKKFVVE